jgi:acyl-CoA dehydrogenase
MFTEEKYSEFAKEFIASQNLCASLDFPVDIWKSMGKKHLFSHHVPSNNNGEKPNFRNLTRACYALAKNGNCLGLVLSFLVHEIISGFVVGGHGNKKHQKLLKALSSGSMISFAVSELNVGAHPKHLKTRAVKEGDHYIINGSKAYLTNGPIADHFIVIAITNELKSKKEYSAFLVSSDNPGLEKTEPMIVPFFKPAPHGGIILNDCRVPEKNLIGRSGLAWDEIVIPFNLIENSVMTGAVAGGIEKQLDLIASYINKKELNKEYYYLLGELKSIQETLLVISSEMAKHSEDYGFYQEHFSLLLFFRRSSASFQEKAADLIKKMNLKTCTNYNSIKNDLIGSAKIAENSIKLKQQKLGESLIFHN